MRGDATPQPYMDGVQLHDSQFRPRHGFRSTTEVGVGRSPDRVLRTGSLVLWARRQDVTLHEYVSLRTLGWVLRDRLVPQEDPTPPDPLRRDREGSRTSSETYDSRPNQTSNIDQTLPLTLPSHSRP